MQEWLPFVLTVIGSAGSAFIGVKVGAARAEERQRALEARMDKVEREIGTHETGLRGNAHRISNLIPGIEGRIEAVEDRLEAIEIRIPVIEERLNRRTR